MTHTDHTPRLADLVAALDAAQAEAAAAAAAEEDAHQAWRAARARTDAAYNALREARYEYRANKRQARP